MNAEHRWDMVPRMHYGWVICAGCFLLNFCALGMATSTISVFYPYLKESLNLSNTQISLISTCRCLASTVTISFAGWYYRRLSLRIGAAAACVLLALSSLLFARADSAAVCCLAALVMGTAYSFGAIYPITVLINNWFSSHTATAMGISLCGSSACALLLPPVVTQLIERLGIQVAFYVEAVFIFLCALTLLAILRETPQSIGVKPYDRKDNISPKNTRVWVYERLTKQESLMTAVVMLLTGIVAAPGTTHYIVHYRTAGYIANQAAAAMSIYGLLLAAGKYLFGVWIDRFGTYRANYVFMTLWIVSCFTLSALDGVSLPMLYGVSVLNGLGMSVGSIGIATWSKELTTDGDYAMSVQHNQFIFTMGSLLGMPIPGVIADYTGSYAGAYLLYGLLILAAFLMIQRLYRRHSKTRDLQHG